jgi:ElaB/YqjD/DUF883 family membrane-anchored ribosome-binding protein
MAGAGDRGGNPQQGAHPRMGAGLPPGPGGAGETLREMASNVGEAVSHAGERVQELASGATERLGEAWESTRRSVREGAQAVTDRARNFWSDAQGLVRRYPFAAMGIAFGLGCLLTVSLRSMSGWDEDDVARGMSRASYR